MSIGIKDLNLFYQYTELENTKYGDYCHFLYQLYINKYTYMPKYLEEGLEVEIKKELQNFKENTELKDVVHKIKSQELVWKNTDEQ